MNNFSYSTKELADIAGPINLNMDTGIIPKNIKSIGLTGASGFLGLHLISQLVNISNISKIKCFIRSKETFNKRKKFFGLNFHEEKLEFFYEFNEENTKDLDIFIHNAAQVHNLKKLSGLYKDNVELSKKVVEKVACPIIYIGTLSVYASSNIKGTHFPEPCNPSENHLLYGGYAQSKWMGEYLISQRIDSKIIRLGLLTPSTVNPIVQENEFFTLFLKLLKRFPYYPEGFENSFVDISPIDLVIKEIIKVICLDRKYIHIANKEPTSILDLINALNLKPINKKYWDEHNLSLKRIEKILLEYAYFKTDSLKKYPEYFNIDLFQTTGHNWMGSIYVKDLEQYIRSISINS